MSTTVSSNSCPKCGAPIPAEAPQGLCPKCVLAGAATGTETGLPSTATAEIPSLERVAAAFPQLQIIELIGRGGMGFVFKARQPHLDRFVALKLLPDKLARDPRFAERFNREGRVLARLNHPNIVSVFDFGQTGGFYFLLMEYIDGVNLRQAMRAGRFSPGEALSVVPKICEALQYAHEQGILHRDIKPENILLDTRGRVKIADFGIAKLVGEEKPEVALTATGAAIGTLHYMAPEQLEKPSEVDHRADIYSLGVVFYEMLTGELPIGRFAPPSSKTPVDHRVDEVVFRALEKEREKRFQSAGEVGTSVEQLATTGATGPAPLGPEGTTIVADGSSVERPAKALLATGVVNWIGSIVVVCLLAFTRLGETWPVSLTELCLIGLLIFSLTTVIFVGALKMLRLQSYRLAMLASVLAMITSPGSIIGLPVGLWAIVTLRQPKVRAAFGIRNRTGQFPVSWWAGSGAALVGLSLPAPLVVVTNMFTGRGGLGPEELWPSLLSVALPGLGGTLLGWLGLNEIRESRGRVRGLPLAIFATLMWPLLIACTIAVGVPMAYLATPGEPGVVRPMARLLVLLLPAGVLTFAMWSVYATTRWASQQNAPPRRGVLKWIFIGLLVCGMGWVQLRSESSKARRAAAQAEAARRVEAARRAEAELPPSIRFTFTAVELRDAAGKRWLTMDFVEQVQGACQRTFRNDSRVPGFTGETQTTSMLVKHEAGFPPVFIQRVQWKLPDALSHTEAEAFRHQVARQWVGKPTIIEPGDERSLFKLAVPESGTVAAFVGVTPSKETP